MNNFFKCRIVRPFIVIIAAMMGVTAAARPINAANNIYYLLPSYFDEWQTASQKIIEAVFAQRGYKVISLDANNNQGTQNRQLRDVIDLLPPAIIVSAVNISRVDRDAIARAMKVGIHVMTYDVALPGIKVDFNSLTDASDIGNQAGQNAIRLLREAKKPGGKILEVLGDPRDPWSFDVQTAFETQLFSYAPSFKIVSRAVANWDEEKAYKIVASQLDENQDIDLIYALSGDLAKSAIDVLRRKDKVSDRNKERHPGDIIIISSNGAPAGLKNIREGWQQLEIEQPIYAQAYGLGLFLDGEMKCPAGKRKCDCKILGVDGSLNLDHENGPTLKLRGRVVSKVDDPSYWGNLILPQFAEKPVWLAK